MNGEEQSQSEEYKNGEEQRQSEEYMNGECNDLIYFIL